jgi:hypothetical protein
MLADLPRQVRDRLRHPVLGLDELVAATRASKAASSSGLPAADRLDLGAGLERSVVYMHVR